MNNKMIRQGLAAIAIVAMAICGVLISVGSENTLAAFGAKVDNSNNFASVPQDPCAVPDTLPVPLFHYSLASSGVPNNGDTVPDQTPGNDDGQFLGTVYAQSYAGPCNQLSGQYYFSGPNQPVSSPWYGNEIRSGPNNLTDPDTFTVALWFRYDNTSWRDVGAARGPDSDGGVLAQFGEGPANVNFKSSGEVDRSRALVLLGNGRLRFWVKPPRWWTPVETVDSPASSYRDGNWHHVVASMGGNGMRLYVDGVRVAQNGNTNGIYRSGKWYFADGRETYNSSGWLGWNQFEGNMKHIAYWQQQLTDAQVATLASTAP